MRSLPRRLVALVVLIPLLLSACVSLPAGPSVMVLPGTGKPFEEFQIDDASCRQWAHQQTGATAGDAQARSGVASAVIGTLIGAAAGAAIGAAAGNPGLGAAVGAGGGLVMGSAAGVNASAYSAGETQRRFDAAYQQCMYAKGHQVPASPARATYRRVYAAPPPPVLALPPPPAAELPPVPPPPPPVSR